MSSNAFGRFTWLMVLMFMTCPPVSLDVVERGGAGATLGQRRPLMRAERNGGRQEGLLPAALHLRDDGLARIASHQLVVHQVVLVEEQAADRAVGDDAHQRDQHVLRS